MTPGTATIETGHAPIPTGYSEVIFGRLFKAAGWDRDQTVVSNKLWWEFWPEQSPEQELVGSLGRMGLDHVDLIYSEPPPDSLSLDDAVGMITGLISAGIARAWGTLNWPGELMEQAWQIADRAGVPGPVATQPPYSLVKRDAVENAGMRAVVAARDVAIVASYALAGGVLTGKYDHDERAGRAAGQLASPGYRAGVTAGHKLAALANPDRPRSGAARHRLHAAQPGGDHRAVRRDQAAADLGQRHGARGRR